MGHGHNDKPARRRRARFALEGLSVGDGFGEQFFGPSELVVPQIAARATPAAPWRYTDDTEMALSIVEQLEERGAIERDDLAARFARRMDVARGYGEGAYAILSAIREGRPWQSVSRGAFRGMGSFGNGAAMRVAPIGAYFADDLDRVVGEATASAEVTHAHPEGIAGAIAVAVAAALSEETQPRAFLQRILEHVPAGYTHDGLKDALALPDGCGVIAAASALGNGSGVTAPDTVPFCLWVVAHHLHASYEEALWTTVSALGDRDTTCAIVGGVLAVRTDVSIPAVWQSAREALPI